MVAAVVLWVMAGFAGGVGAGVLSDAKAYYEQGDAAAALEQFEKVQERDPNEATLIYNQANCHYKLEEVEQARALLEKVLAQSSDAALLAKAHYNLGNCYFRQAAAQEDPGQLQDVLKTLQEAVKHYRQTLLIDAEDEEARRNIALARGLMAQIVEQLEQQKKEQKQKEEEQENLAEKIRKLLERQKVLIAGSEVVQQAEQTVGVDPNLIVSRQGELHSGQSVLQEDTAAVQKEVEGMLTQAQQGSDGGNMIITPDAKPGGTGSSAASVYGLVNEEMAAAVDAQGAAVDDLADRIMAVALEDQNEAAQHLQKALDALKQEQEKGQDSQQEKQDQDSEKEQEKKEDQKQQDGEGKAGDDENKQEQEPQDSPSDQESPAQPSGDSPESDLDEKQVAPLDMTAQEILDKEKERQRQKRRVIMRGLQTEDKNW